MYPWNYYLEKTKELISKHPYKNPPSILKTSCNSEASDKPLIGGVANNIDADVTCLENDIIIIEKLRHTNLKITQGSIRDLPFKRNSFDIILDLSTLDRIPEREIGDTLEGYAKVLKRKGHIILIYSAGNETARKRNPNKWTPKAQYYFNQEKVSDVFSKHFEILDEETLYHQEDFWLVYLLGRRKK